MAKKKDEITIRSSAAEYLTYVASVGDQQDSIEMRYEDENIWLTQKMMATLYDVGLPTINEHIKKIYADSELEESATIRNFRIVQTEGSRQVTRDTKHYSLQMIIGQHGYSYNPMQKTVIEDWNPNYVVIANCNADPYCIDISMDNSPVYYAVHGEGEWEFEKDSESLEVFFEFLGIR